MLWWKWYVCKQMDLAKVNRSTIKKVWLNGKVDKTTKYIGNAW